MQRIDNGDTLIIFSFKVLSDKAEEIIKVINCILSHGATLYVCNPPRIINAQTKIIDVFPLLNDIRQAQQEKTNQIGRPKGSRSSSKFDVYHSRIMEMLKAGMSVSAIARALEVRRSSLKDYIESRGLKELAGGSWIKVLPTVKNIDNVLLICPFEHQEKNKKGKVV